MSTDDRGQMMGPRISAAVSTVVILVSIVLSQFQSESTSFRKATREITTNDPGGTLLLLAVAAFVAGSTAVISWWRGGESNVDG